MFLRYDRSKYNAQKVIYNGDKYDSKKERDYAIILDGLLSEGKIKGWTRQVNFPLPDMNYLDTGSKRSRYQADFIVTTLDGNEHIVEIKGLMTPEMKVKYSFFQFVYSRRVHIVPTTGLNPMNTDWLTCTKCMKGDV